MLKMIVARSTLGAIRIGISRFPLLTSASSTHTAASPSASFATAAGLARATDRATAPRNPLPPTTTSPTTATSRCSTPPSSPPAGIRKLVSSVDDSINYIHPYGRITSTTNGDTNSSSGSYLEARYVRRSPNYVSVYLSSHTGCRMGCQFCWLTAQRQQSFHHVDVQHYLQQLHSVLRDVPDPPAARQSIRVNINLMARGEALANSTIVNHYDAFYDAMRSAVVDEHGFGGGVKINCSTIMPHTVRARSLAADVFKYRPVSVYYSLYSIQPHFRSKWMPNAIPAMEALDQLKQMQLDYQQHIQQQQQHTQQQQLSQQQHQTSTQPTHAPAIKVPGVNFHWAFIAGENDNEADVLDLLRAIKQREFVNSKFNLVRFNAHPRLAAEGYRETDPVHLQRLFDLISAEMNSAGVETQHSRIVPRAGPDVYASCGMFVDNAHV